MEFKFNLLKSIISDSTLKGLAYWNLNFETDEVVGGMTKLKILAY